MKQRTISFRLAAAVLVLLMTCAPLGACSLGSRGDALDIPGFDMRVKDSEANAQAALEYLAPDGEISDGWWVPGERTRERWETLADSWDSSTLEELTAAMAAVSTMRSSPDEETSAAATWVTARSIEFAVDQVPSRYYTDAVKENLAVVVVNTADEGVKVATGGSPKGLGLYQGEKGKDLDDANSLYTTMVYRVIDNKAAAANIRSALFDAAMERYPDVGDVTTLEMKYQIVGSVYGYLTVIGGERMVDVMGANAEFDNPIGTTRWALEAMAYADAVNQGLFTDPEAFNSEYLQDGGSGEPYSWYTTNDDGTTTFTLDAPPSSEQSAQIHSWANAIDPEHDPEYAVMRADSGVNAGVRRGVCLIRGGDGIGGEPGEIAIKKN
ncbi:DUF6571 family protein [Actinomyces glycerinitolerans]|uniref:DUF6571 domain-containing protein n=1 Tax=Actinomyces glycerinitolerans TaxID=1892869 RepID=A0A1M4RX72_9ACTO|nr:DUF6571 family protein [Actinomyces glycerinitolerans]SHE24500.1 Hypothetical protein ACGLYG10_0704 [Actinomyces glycerinitolerans]